MLVSYDTPLPDFCYEVYIDGKKQRRPRTNNE